MADKQTRHFVEFMTPGTFVSESRAKEITDDAVVGWPASAYAMRTYARSVTTLDGEELLGKPRDYSPWTYRGEEWTRDRVERELPDERTLILNMRGNGYDRVGESVWAILSRCGWRTHRTAYPHLPPFHRSPRGDTPWRIDLR